MTFKFFKWEILGQDKNQRFRRKKFELIEFYHISNIQVFSLFYRNNNFFSKFKIFYLEPVGFKSPTLSSDFEGTRLRKSSKNAIVLLCQSQGYPVPEFR